MIARAIARFVRVSPRKTRYVLNVIRRKEVEEAFSILDNVGKGAAFYVKQILKSALDSAIKKTNGEVDASNLFISKITADSGPMLKRYKAGSMGRAMPIKRRTAHILIELDMVRKSNEGRKKRDEGRQTKSKERNRPSSIVHHSS
jgi:large subunit ribosomal protein L22